MTDQDRIAALEARNAALREALERIGDECSGAVGSAIARDALRDDDAASAPLPDLPLAEDEGPSVEVRLSCLKCRHHQSKYYAVQGDSGYIVDCTHTSHPRRIGDTNWSTPDWCSLREQALARRGGHV